MGDIAEAMLDGTLCEGCGVFIDDGPAAGFPRYCSAACAPDGVLVEEGDDEDYDFEAFDLEFEISCLRDLLIEGRAAEGLSAPAVKLLDDVEAALKAFDAGAPS